MAYECNYKKIKKLHAIPLTKSDLFRTTTHLLFYKKVENYTNLPIKKFMYYAKEVVEDVWFGKNLCLLMVS